MLNVPFVKKGNKYHFTPTNTQQLYQLHYGLGLHYNNDIILQGNFTQQQNLVLLGLPHQYGVTVTHRLKTNNPYTMYHVPTEYTIYYYHLQNQITVVLTQPQYNLHKNYLKSFNGLL